MNNAGLFGHAKAGGPVSMQQFVENVRSSKLRDVLICIMIEPISIPI